MSNSAQIQHVVDSCRGVYSGQFLAEFFGQTIREQCPDLDHEIDELLAGPEGNSWYFDALDRVLAEGAVTDLRTGDRFVFHEDQGIYLVLDSLEWCDVCSWFCGPECGSCTTEVD